MTKDKDMFCPQYTNVYNLSIVLNVVGGAWITILNQSVVVGIGRPRRLRVQGNVDSSSHVVSSLLALRNWPSWMAASSAAALWLYGQCVALLTKH